MKVIQSIPTPEKWLVHNVKKLLRYEEVKILWDFEIQIDKYLARNIPDITVVEKMQMWATDVAVSGDSKINQWKRSLSIKTCKTSGNFRVRKELSKTTPKSSTTGNSLHPAKIPLRLLYRSSRGLE